MGWISHTALAVVLVCMALLSRRLGRVTHAPPNYVGLWVAAGIVMMSPLARIVNGWRQVDPNTWVGWAFIYAGLPALGVSIGVVFAWRYWSWLLAERD